MEIKRLKDHWGVKIGDPTDDSNPADFELPSNKENLEIIPLELALIDEKIPKILKKYKLEASDADISSIKNDINKQSESIVDAIYNGIKEYLGENKSKLDLLDFKKEPIRGVIDHLVDKVTLLTMAAIIGMIPENERTPIQITNLNKIEKIEAGWEESEKGGEALLEEELSLEEAIKKNLLNELNLQLGNIRAYINRIEKNEVPNRGFNEANAKELGDEIVDLYNEKNLSKYGEAVKLIINSRDENDLTSISIACKEFLIHSAFKNYPQLKRISNWMEFDEPGSEPKPPIWPKKEKRPINFEAVVRQIFQQEKDKIYKAIDYINELNPPKKVFIAVGELDEKELEIIKKAESYKPLPDQISEFEKMGINITVDLIDELWDIVRNNAEYLKKSQEIRQELDRDKKRSLKQEKAILRDEILKNEIRGRMESYPVIGEYAAILLTVEALIHEKKIIIGERVGEELPSAGEDLADLRLKIEASFSAEEVVAIDKQIKDYSSIYFKSDSGGKGKKEPDFKRGYINKMIEKYVGSEENKDLLRKYLNLALVYTRPEKNGKPEEGEIKITPDQWEYVEYTKELIGEYILKAPKIASEAEGRDVSLGDLREQLTSFVGELWKSLGEKKYERAFSSDDLERIVNYIIQAERKYRGNS